MSVKKASERPFAQDVAAVFGMQITVAVVGLANAFLLAALLGPAGKGIYYLVLLLPTTLLVLGQVGVPSALTYFAGRGQVGGLARKAFGLGAGLAIGLVVLAALFLSIVRPGMIAALPVDLVGLALVATPLQFLVSFGGGLLIGRRAIRLYAAVMISQVVAATFLLVVLIGVLQLDVRGAVIAHLILNVATASAMIVGALRLPDAGPGMSPAPPLSRLLAYGFRIWPGSVTTFFSYRADVYIISWLIASPIELGVYSIAVGLAEIVFHVPDSVSTVFFPRVAGSDPETAAEAAPEVSRVTFLATALVAIALIPAAAIALQVVLPAFIGALNPLILLLPGVVMLSVAKVLSGLITGSGRAGMVSLVAVVVAGVNVVVNILLIPRLGIAGASIASTVSYGLEAVLLVAVASRLTGRPAASFLVPRRSDVQLILRSVRRTLGSLHSGARAALSR